MKLRIVPDDIVAELLALRAPLAGLRLVKATAQQHNALARVTGCLDSLASEMRGERWSVPTTLSRSSGVSAQWITGLCRTRRVRGFQAGTGARWKVDVSSFERWLSRTTRRRAPRARGAS